MIFTLPAIIGIGVVSGSIASAVAYPCAKKLKNKLQHMREVNKMKKFIAGEIENSNEELIFHLILDCTPINTSSSPVVL